MKKISRIHSVQFHNIVPEESLEKIISFKIDQTQQKTGVINVSELLEMMSSLKDNQIIAYDDFKLIIKE